MRAQDDMGDPVQYASSFWGNVDRKDSDSCWNWLKSTDAKGYGIQTIRRESTGKRSSVRAHRFSWILHNGSVPEGLSVLHTCDNRRCCNPNHLWLGTNVDNNRDMREKGRDQTGRKCTEETKLKMSKAQLNRYSNPEEILKLSLSQIARQEQIRQRKVAE